MSGKLLNSFRDENRDLQKQIGCMNGIFQFFDGRHFLSKRRISSQNQKRLPPGQSGNHGMESSSMTQETIRSRESQSNPPEPLFHPLVHLHFRQLIAIK
ncbi:hypothetical protein CsSME_00005271 [Camellia sinensis var. sinensis]